MIDYCARPDIEMEIITVGQKVIEGNAVMSKWLKQESEQKLRTGNRQTDRCYQSTTLLYVR